MKKLLAIVAFAALASFTANAAPTATTSGAATPTPTKADVLAAISVIEKDPLSDQGLDAMKPVITFAADSDAVSCALENTTVPWFGETGNPDDKEMSENARYILSASYLAGNIQSQLKNGKPLDDPRAGWLFVIRAYKQLVEKIKFSSPSIERLDALESQGWLAEYAAVVMQDVENPKTEREIPDSQKLTRDCLSPAHDFLKTGDYDKACALYETWLAQNPYDAEAHYSYGAALKLQASATNDEKIAATLTKKARSHALMAAALGSTDPMLSGLLQTTAPDYDKTKKTLSTDSKAHDYMAQAEKAFVQRRFEEAGRLYQKALKHDPKSYHATLFTGDSYYAAGAGNLSLAIEWFQKAIALDPDKEIAHRYLGDALRKAGKRDEAIAEYIAALIAEPFVNLPRARVENIARDENPLFKTSPLRDVPMPSTEVNPTNKTISLVLNPANNNPMMVAYVTARADWTKTEGTKRFPADRHHCAEEEAAGLRAFAAKVFELNDEKNTDASNYLAAAVAIQKLDEAGLLEAAIYLDRADKDIAQDYPAYREKHRDLLERYLREFWLGQTP